MPSARSPIKPYSPAVQCGVEVMMYPHLWCVLSRAHATCPTLPVPADEPCDQGHEATPCDVQPQLDQHLNTPSHEKKLMHHGVRYECLRLSLSRCCVEWHSNAVPHLPASMMGYRAHLRWACSSCLQSGPCWLQRPIAATHPSLLRRLHCIEMLRTISLQTSYWLQCQGHLACP